MSAAARSNHQDSERDARPFRAALSEGWPVLLTVLVIGATYGVLARQSGLSPLETLGMSVIMFAGAAQFATIGLLQAGAGPLEIGASVVLINLRHLLMAASLRPVLERASLPKRMALAFVLTDEAFAMSIGWFRRGHRDLVYYATYGSATWLVWNGGTVAGSALGANIADPSRYGIDFAISACFAAIVAMGARHRTDVVVGLAAALAAGVLRLSGASTTAVVVAGALAPLVAFALPKPRP